MLFDRTPLEPSPFKKAHPIKVEDFLLKKNCNQRANWVGQQQRSKEKAAAGFPKLM